MVLKIFLKRPLVPDIKLWRPFRRTDTANVIRLANSTTWRLFGNIDIHEMLYVYTLFIYACS